MKIYTKLEIFYTKLTALSSFRSIKCNKYGKFKNPKISYIFNGTLIPSICDKCNNDAIVKEQESKKY